MSDRRRLSNPPKRGDRRFTDAQILCLFASLFGPEADHALEVLVNDRTRRTHEAAVLLQLPPAGVRLRDMERALVIATLEQVDGVQKRAAERLGLSRPRLNRKMQALGIVRPSWRFDAHTRREAMHDIGKPGRYHGDAEPNEGAGEHRDGEDLHRPGCSMEETNDDGWED